MSGYDEVKPYCQKCKPQYSEGFDDRRLLARNREGNNLNIITSDYDESLTGIRVVMFSPILNGSNVISYVRCSHCGEKYGDSEFVFAVKKYIWFYKDKFGLDYNEWNKQLDRIRYGDTSDISEPNYDEFVDDDDDTCPNCGYPYSECECETCSECGYLIDDCTCDDY